MQEFLRAAKKAAVRDRGRMRDVIIRRISAAVIVRAGHGMRESLRGECGLERLLVLSLG